MLFGEKLISFDIYLEKFLGKIYYFYNFTWEIRLIQRYVMKLEKIIAWNNKLIIFNICYGK
jgi:hypothetical protein